MADRTLTAPGRTLEHVMRDQLVLSWTDEAGSHRKMVGENVIVGSAEENPIRISDPTVSRLHAEITWRDSGPWIRDLGSRNGTFVNGVQVESARLTPLSTLALGETPVEVAANASPKKIFLWPKDSFGPVFGASRPMRELFARLSRISRTDSTALIVGETGTGKELIARAIHEASDRSDGPFITVDCTAMPSNLFESELFGHTKGAFTGATESRRGAFEAASGGTIFLDEIGELIPVLQPKLLRVLQEKTVRRVGESQHRSVDCRIVAATNRNLAELASAGTFREDLFFRLAVFMVDVPPLRKRGEDIPLLAKRFLSEESDLLTPEMLAWMSTHAWPGNVRELQSFVARAEVLGFEDAKSQIATVGRREHEPFPTPDLDRPFKTVREEWLSHLEREFVEGWLARTSGNVSAAADAMGLNRTYVHRLVKKHGLEG